MTIIESSSNKQWWIWGFSVVFCVSSLILSLIIYRYALPKHDNIQYFIDSRDNFSKNQENILHYNDLSKRVENIEDRYSTFVAEIGIWITFMAGIIPIITLIISYVVQDKANEKFKTTNKLVEGTRKDLECFKNKFEEEFKLKERFYHSCLGLQAINMLRNVTTPLIKSMVYKMLLDISELRAISPQNSSWISKYNEFLMLHNTLHYIFPILKGEENVVISTYQIQSLQDKLYRLIILQGKLIAISSTKSKSEKGESMTTEEKNIQEETSNLIDLIFKQISFLSNILQEESCEDMGLK